MQFIKLFIFCNCIFTFGCSSQKIVLNPTEIQQIRCYSGDWIMSYRIAQDYKNFKQAYHARTVIITNRDTINLIIQELNKLKKSKLTGLQGSNDVRCGIEIDFFNKSLDTMSINPSYLLKYQNIEYEITYEIIRLLRIKYIDIREEDLRNHHREVRKLTLKSARKRKREDKKEKG